MRLLMFCNTCLSSISSRPARSLQYYVLLIRFLLLLLFLGSLEILLFSFSLEAFANTATPSEAVPVASASTPSESEVVRVPVASASDAGQVMDDSYLEFLEDYLDETDDITTMELYDLLLGSLSGPAMVSNSEALEDIKTSVDNIQSYLIPDIGEFESSDTALASLPEELETLALGGDFTLNRNVVIYEGVWNGSSARLVLPSSVEGSLFVDTDGALYNVGTSSVTGRIFYDDFEPLEYRINYFTLSPCLGNNASILYNGGYPSSCRRYYESGSRLTYTDTYGLFYVSDTVHTVSDDRSYFANIYLLIMIFLEGVMLLCFWNKSHS